MYRNSFILCILTLVCFITLIPSVGSAQSDKVKASMAALKAETEAARRRLLRRLALEAFPLESKPS
jgi:hypothetical protein